MEAVLIRYVIATLFVEAHQSHPSKPRQNARLSNKTHRKSHFYVTLYLTPPARFPSTTNSANLSHACPAHLGARLHLEVSRLLAVPDANLNDLRFTA